MTEARAPDFLWTLFAQLRRRHFPLSPEDYEALRRALQAGFGWSSQEALCALCCALWSKSKQEQEIVEALFHRLEVPSWTLPETQGQRRASAVFSEETSRPEALATDSSLVIESHGELPPISLNGEHISESPFVFVPQFPLTYREVAQAWRRLRQPVRAGPLTELDVDASVARRCRSGVVSDVVMISRRRNTARLLLLIDRQGSMTPFHRFVQEVCTAIQKSGNLERVALYYFHDVPAEGADETVLALLSDQLFPILDSVLHEVTPLAVGDLYRTPELLEPESLH